jgi:hypothetical protein
MRGSYGSLVTWTAAAGIILATSLGFYVWAHGSMSHAVSFFFAAASVLTLERAWTRHGAFDAVMLGVWSGLLTVTRYQDVTWGAVFGLGLVGFWTSAAPPPVTHKRVLRNRWEAGVAFAIGVVIPFIPQMIVWKALYGSYLSGPLPYTDGRMGDWEPWPTHLLGVLWSERGGAFAWHPVLLLGLLGLLCAREGLAPAMRTVALVGLALQVWLVASWSWWWGGSSFGNRFFVSAYPCLALGLAEFLSALRRRGPVWVGPALVAALVVWNCGLLVQFGTDMIPRDRGEGGRWATVIRQQFVDVPRWILSRVVSASHGALAAGRAS